MRTILSTTLPILVLFFAPVSAQVRSSAFVNFEGAQTNPIRLSRDSTRLFAVNTPDARVSVFDLSQPSSPALIAEIPVGIEPVSVNPRTSDEAWVVNQVSDSISIVSVSRGIVTDTIYVKDEPSDVVFAGNNAFVSVSRSNQIAVFDVITHTLVKAIALQGHNPRALAVSGDGATVYVAFALSGNHTTIVPEPFAPPQPPPANPNLPSPPKVPKIIEASDPAYSSVIRYTVLDNDVAAIDTATLNVKGYIAGVGTINLGLAVRPITGELFVSNTDALNVTDFEPNLRGHFVNNRLTRIQPSGQKTFYDLNPALDYSVLPNPAALATALAQPAGLAFSAAGRYLYAAAFGTDRVAQFDVSTGQIVSRIEIGGAGVNPVAKRGPRGLALSNGAQRLYVLNRISNTISVVDLSNNGIVAEILAGSFDPTPLAIRKGRGFLYDARLSGNGTGSCASCHVDADMDFLGWDLGDPGGDMGTAQQNGNTFLFHPMKGPMVTQSLRGLNKLAPYHWRGDRANFKAFNPAFASLLGGAQLSDADMRAYSNFIDTIVYQPNPNQNLDRTLPASVTLPPPMGAADPNAGMNIFLTNVLDPVGQPGVTCNTCHTSNPGPGSNRALQTGPNTGQTVKTPHLRNLYQKMPFHNTPGLNSILGFGFSHGGQDTMFNVLSRPILGNVATDNSLKLPVFAFMMCFDTGTAPAVGYTRTLTSGSVGGAAGDWSLLESQAAAGNIDLIAKGAVNGQVRGLLYRPGTHDYQSDKTGVGPFTQADLTAAIQAGDTLSIMGVPPGTGLRMGIDRNLDGILDGDQ